MSDLAPFDWTMSAPRVRRVDVGAVARSFGRVQALWNVTTTFEAGRISVLLGPNGAGKTTLMHLLATLDRPTEGTIAFDQRLDSVAHRETVRPHIGLVGHDSLLYADLSGRENLAFFCRMYGVSPDQVDRWLERVDLVEAADRQVGGYSRGMKQRLSIARALLAEPSVVLFDEPLTGLDRASRTFFWRLAGWLRARDRTTIVITHHLAWPPGLCDQAVVLDRGRVRVDRDPDEEELAQVYASAVRER